MIKDQLGYKSTISTSTDNQPEGAVYQDMDQGRNTSTER